MNAATQSCAFAPGHAEHRFYSPIRGRNRSKSRGAAHEGRHNGATATEGADLVLGSLEFCDWLSQAHPGESIVYHRGLLAVDTSLLSRSLSDAARKELVLVARCARCAAEDGLVHLLQQRLAPDQFAYLAVARPRLSTRSRPTPNRNPKEKA